MGTSADFYIGNKFIGSVGMDGYPGGIPEAVRKARTPKAFRQAVAETLTSGRSAYLPHYPFGSSDCAVRGVSPLRSERPTSASHYTYVFDKGRVKATNEEAHGWFDPARREPKWSQKGDYAGRENVDVLAHLNALNEAEPARPELPVGALAVGAIGLAAIGAALFYATKSPAAPAAPAAPVKTLGPFTPPAPTPGGSKALPIAAPAPRPPSPPAPRPAPAAAPTPTPTYAASTPEVPLTTAPQGLAGLALASAPPAPAPGVPFTAPSPAAAVASADATPPASPDAGAYVNPPSLLDQLQSAASSILGS